MAVFQDKNNKTKDGRSWYFSTYYTTLSGERKKYKSKKYVLKKDAEEAERKFLIKLTDKVETNNMTFKELILAYQEHQKDRVKITSYEDYKKLIKYIKSLENVKIKDYNIIHFNQWKKTISELNLSTTYKNNIYKFLRAILNYAIKYHNFELNNIMNKMTNFTNPNELKQEMQFFTYKEFMLFIAEEEELKYKAYFETLYYCGLRKGEANALTWEDIDFNKKIINIKKSLTLKIKGEPYVILPPKTKSSVRTLPIPKALLNSLKLLYNEYNKYTNFNKKWFVFGGPIPLKDTTVQNKRTYNCKKAKVKQIRIHDFRHSCASLLISNGASISLVAKYLGHSNISTTLNTYTHMLKNEMSEIINIINDL